MGIRAPLLDCVYTAGLALLPTLQAAGLRWAQAASPGGLVGGPVPCSPARPPSRSIHLQHPPAP